ncbi:MAG: type III pantothenate kinase [Eubacterium sp.]|uniref:type III pantothenate kinase n=1 Tax=Eubacterium sp. TaxID=142586 RepID=UPI003A2BC547
MILAIDVGNTNIVLGVLNGEELVCSGRLSTNVNETDIEYSMKIKTFLDVKNITEIEGAVISSVVPALVRTLKKAVRLVCGVDSLVVGPGIKTGLNIKLDNPAEMGADLVVGDVAVINKYPLPAILFDIGTATTASVIDKNGAHLGGAIMCGVKTAINSLSKGTAQLPQIDISAPSKIIGANTIDAMKCGSVIGTAAMIEGMVERFEEELGEKATVIITGGLGNAIAKVLRIDVTVDENLLLDGLRIIYEKNKK